MKYFLKRAGFMILTLFAACALTFFLMNVIPGGTAELIIKHTFVGLEESVTEEQINQVSSRYNLDDPLYLQFFMWVKEAVLRGDIGTSYVFKKPVLYLLTLRLPATVQLAGASMGLSVVAGVSLGIYSAPGKPDFGPRPQGYNAFWSFDARFLGSPAPYPGIFPETETCSCIRVREPGKPVFARSSPFPPFRCCDYESHQDKHA